MGRTKPTVSESYVVGLTDGEGCFYVNIHPLQSYSKQRSFEAFCQIARLVKTKRHLTVKGLDRIKLLKSEMNKKLLGSRSAGNPLATSKAAKNGKQHGIYYQTGYR